MASYTVTTPAPGHTGAVGGVTFVDGTAVVDGKTHAAELAYFTAQGYGVVEVTDGPVDDTAALRAEAAELGLKVHHNAKADTIRKQIADAHATADENDTPPSDEPGSDEENAP